MNKCLLEDMRNIGTSVRVFDMQITALVRPGESGKGIDVVIGFFWHTIWWQYIRIQRTKHYETKRNASEDALWSEDIFYGQALDCFI